MIAALGCGVEQAAQVVAHALTGMGLEGTRVLEVGAGATLLL